MVTCCSLKSPFPPAFSVSSCSCSPFRSSLPLSVVGCDCEGARSSVAGSTSAAGSTLSAAFCLVFLFSFFDNFLDSGADISGSSASV